MLEVVDASKSGDDLGLAQVNETLNALGGARQRDGLHSCSRF